MKNVLFIGGTTYNLERENKNLEKKFLGLSRGMNVFVAARGRPSYKKIYNSEFYLVSKNAGIFKWLMCFFKSFYICWKKDINTIVSQSPLIDGLIAVILKNIFKTELIVEIHGDWIEAVFLYNKRRPFIFLKNIPQALGKFSLRNADKIRGVAKYLLNRAGKIAPKKKYFLFPTFTDVDFFLKEQNIRFDNFILFVGYLNRVKGVRYLIEAFSKIKNEFPKFSLKIIGKGPEKQSLKRQAEKLGISNRVEFLGELSQQAVKNIMQNCYFLVSSSLSEGLPLVIREAMALAKPVIGSNVGGIPEIIEHGKNGFLFEKGNTDDLAEKIKILLHDKDLARKMGQNGQELIKQKFSNQHHIQSYINMVNAV